ncbi:MAG TPA: sugar-binding protein [Chryseobacterium sp.]|nr:sugar-binding protein [Chryseobacterium sp.]
MKKIIIPVSILLMAGTINAQLTSTENYIQAKTYLDYDAAGQPVKNSETVQYFDGLGRLKQTVGVKYSPLGNDVVTPVEYDSYGRQAKDYLPIPQGGTLNGGIIPNPTGSASTFYGGEKIYSEKIIENSPLDRIKQQIQVGNDWSAKPVNFGYEANIGEDYVRKYEVSTTWVEERTQTSVKLLQYFQAAQLYKNMVTDEDGNKTIEFKNTKGQTLLVRKVLSPTENADTYYVYNEYDQLAFVIPPLASAPTVEPATVESLYYQYRYDGRGRLVEKKLPGKDWEYMVYDRQDRLVLTQDANLRAKGQWLFTKYDQFSRPVYAGILNSAPGRLQQVNAIESKGSNYEVRTTSGWSNSGMTVFYTNNTAYPTTNFKLLSLNYYDAYPGYDFNPPFPSGIQGEPTLSDVVVDGKSTKGLLILNIVKNVGDDSWTFNDKWTKNYTYYDKKGRVIGTHSINHYEGYTRAESKLNFTGTPQFVVTKHKRLPAESEKTITESFIYDHQNRLLVHKHKVDNGSEEILAQNKYNEVSQLESKKVGGTDLATPIQTVDYKYNIRGWISQINDPVALGNDLFGYKLKYQTPEAPSSVARFNGNIAEVDWKTANDGVRRRYGYTYDKLNRLGSAKYQKPDAGVIETNAYNESVTYDLNGNIQSLLRFGGSDGNSALKIDDIKYTYEGNQLVDLWDSSGNSLGLDGGDSMAYDDNGNMIMDNAHYIWELSYNHLNLPESIVKKYEYFKYIYSANGTKLSSYQFLREFDQMIAHDYLDGFQYKDGVLQFVPTNGGYYSFAENRYVYNYTDHLGNTRVSYIKNGAGAQILEENNYYPFGLNHSGYNSSPGTSSYKYKYNGKELQETGYYDYGARMYMPDLGRWGTSDGKGELYLSKSPYSYANNTPVNAIDPDGNLVIFINGQHGGNGGSREYWSSSNPVGYMTANGGSPFAVYSRFDQAVMRQLNDNNAMYVDGAMGGWKNTFFATENVNTSVTNRINSGFAQGKKDAAEIIKNLARDETSGAIVETIKIVTHSMGGAYGKGYVKALKEYIAGLPKEQQKQIKITLVADFDPFQAGSLKVDPNIKTQQFIHEDNENIKGIGWLANEKEQGISDNNVYINTGSSTDHSVLTFFNDISKLQEGIYLWNGNSWICPKCK